VPDAEAGPVDLAVPRKRAQRAEEGAAPPSGRAVGKASAVWLPACRSLATTGRLVRFGGLNAGNGMPGY